MKTMQVNKFVSAHTADNSSLIAGSWAVALQVSNQVVQVLPSYEGCMAYIDAEYHEYRDEKREWDSYLGDHKVAARDRPFAEFATDYRVIRSDKLSDNQIRGWLTKRRYP